MKDIENARGWMNHAFEEIRSAEHLYRHLYPQSLEVICFLSQQTVEKSLKAFLVFHGVSVQKTHDLTALLRACVEIDSDFSAFYDVCECMAPMAVAVRYPDHYEPTQHDMETAFSGASKIYDFVHHKLGLAQTEELEETPDEGQTLTL